MPSHWRSSVSFSNAPFRSFVFRTFVIQMNPCTRLLAIDPGQVRLGLAISDAERRLASPLTTYTRRNPRQYALFFKKIIEDEEVGQIVIGLPVRLDGYEGEQAKAAREFGAWLQEA